MPEDYWKKQGAKPLFEELEWNKPERRDQAGRLLIIGGNVHALSAPAKSYALTMKTGIGSVKIALPNATKKLVGSTLPNAVFLPSTSSGEFSKDAAHELLQYAQWADSLLLSGDVGRNSQTAILLEELLRSYREQIVVTRDAADILSNTPKSLFQREKTTSIVSFAGLQKLMKNLGSRQPLTFTMDLLQLVSFLQDFSAEYPCNIVTFHHNQIVVAASGKVSTTQLRTTPHNENVSWRTEYAAIAACYQTWYPEQPFEALTHAAHLAESNI